MISHITILSNLDFHVTVYMGIYIHTFIDSNSISPKFENKFQTFTTFKSAKHTKRSTQKRNRRMERSTSMNRGQNRSKSQKREVNVNLQRPEIITSSALSSTTLNGLENENQILSEKYVEAKNAIFDKEYQLQKFEEEIDRLKKENAVVRGGVGVAGEVSGPNELQLIIESLKAKNLKYQEYIYIYIYLEKSKD